MILLYGVEEFIFLVYNKNIMTDSDIWRFGNVDFRIFYKNRQTYDIS